MVRDVVTSRGEPKDLRGIMPVTGERYGQRGRHIQRKHPRIHFHLARTLVTCQRLNYLLGLAVIDHMHDIAVPEGMRHHRNRKIHLVSFGPFHDLFQPVPHGFIGDCHSGSRRRGRVVIIQLSICLT